MAEHPREVRAGEPLSAAWLNNLAALVSQRLHLEGQGYSSSSGTAIGRKKAGRRYFRGYLLGALAAPATCLDPPTSAQVRVLRPDGNKQLKDWREYTAYNYDPKLTAVQGAYCKLEDIGDGILEFYWVSCNNSVEPQPEPEPEIAVDRNSFAYRTKLFPNSELPEI